MPHFLNRTFEDINQTRRFLHRMNVPMPALWGAAFLYFLGVLFNFSGLQLLIPLGQGIIRNNYSGVRDRLGFIGFIDTHFPHLFHDPHLAFFPLAALVLTLVLIQNMFDYSASLLAVQQTKTAEKNLRLSIFTRLTSFGKKYFDLRSTAEIQQLIINYPAAVTGHIRICLKLLSQAMSLTAIFLFLFFLSWRLTLITVFIIPFFFLLSQKIVSKIRDAAKKSDHFMNGFHRKILNLIICMPLIKACGAEKEEQKVFAGECAAELKTTLETEKKILLIKPAEDFNMFIILIVIAAALSFIRNAEMQTDISKYLVFFYVIQQALPRLQAFTDFKIHMARSQSAVEQLEKFFDDRDKFPVRGKDTVFTGLQDKITVKDLNFSYSTGKPVLKELNLSFDKGKTTAILGPTGTGKTTLFNLLLRLYDCPPASIFLDGTDIRDFAVFSWLERIAYVSQDIFLFDHSLLFNLTYGLKQAVTEEEAAEVLRAVRLEKHGLHMQIGERGLKLSGGEKQRLALARAFLKKAEIILLDEATSALDGQTEKDIHAALDRFGHGRTVLIIAHRLSSIMRADKIILLKNGRTAEEGTLEELIKNRGDFFKEWSIQNQGQTSAFLPAKNN